VNVRAQTDARCVRQATLRLPGYRTLRTGRSGTATIVKTFHRTGRRVLVASKRGCAKGRATLTVLPHGERERTDR
jgi:hypothetical protein